MPITLPVGNTTQVKKVVTEPNVKVSKVVVGRPVRRVTSGAFSVNNLIDVDISNLENGSVLVYKLSSQKWAATTDLENQNINGGAY